MSTVPHPTPEEEALARTVVGAVEAQLAQGWFGMKLTAVYMGTEEALAMCKVAHFRGVMIDWGNLEGVFLEVAGVPCYRVRANRHLGFSHVPA